MTNGKIDVFIEDDGKIGTISIADNGGGVPKDLLPNKLFEAYVSTKKDKGTGIGLYMSKVIIENNMGGYLWVLNSPLGAKFTISLVRKQKKKQRKFYDFKHRE